MLFQPHRYSRLASLFEEFCTCMNDAGTVIIADVYAAGEAQMEGFDKDHWPDLNDLEYATGVYRQWGATPYWT